MITSVHIENFKCFKEFDIELGKFNVLVGPNDCGKTAFLEAIRFPCRVIELLDVKDKLKVLSGDGVLHPRIDATGQTFERVPRVRSLDPLELPEELTWNHSKKQLIDIQLEGHPPGTSSKKLQARTRYMYQGPLRMDFSRPEQDAELTDKELSAWVPRVLRTPAFYSLRASDLREPSSVSGKGRFEIGPTGNGFPSFLEDLLRDDTEKFSETSRRFCERFPHYKRIALPKKEIPHKGTCNVLQFVLQNGTVLDASEVSDGTILYLAFLAITNQPEAPSLLLIEEPENGVHFASLQEIVRLLKDLTESSGVQVILTTHSPELLDFVDPEEVRVFSKDEEGAVHCANLASFPEVERMRKHFMTGEIWTAIHEDRIVDEAGKAK